MKTKLFRSILAIVLFMSVIAQSQENTLVFTALDSVYWVQLDSIKIINRSQEPGCDTMLYWPDTTLDLNLVGFPEKHNTKGSLILFQNYPNPVKEQTTVSLYIPDNDEINIRVTDITGKLLINYNNELEKGHHSFTLEPGNCRVCLFTAIWRGKTANIKIINTSSGKGESAVLTYSGHSIYEPYLKSTQNIQEFIYTAGDTLLFVGYSDTLESGIVDADLAPGQVYKFRFSYDIPCPGFPIVFYGGKLYNTVQIFSQCWIKENLDIGTMLQPGEEPEPNGIIEKYCYENNPVNCVLYGGLYTWEEMMKHSSNPGIQGICPEGWHLPTDEEWKILEGVADSQYIIGDPIWDTDWERGNDAGTNLKSTDSWLFEGNGIDKYGYTALPGGYYIMFSFYSLGELGSWWTSTVTNSNYAWGRYMNSQKSGVERISQHKEEGYSVRCVKDEW